MYVMYSQMEKKKCEMQYITKIQIHAMHLE